MLDDGTPLYDRKLSVEEVTHRIEACWKPYHAALGQVLDSAHQKFGKVWHINCHSMPSVAGAYATDRPRHGPPRLRAGRPRRQHQRSSLP